MKSSKAKKKMSSASRRSPRAKSQLSRRSRSPSRKMSSSRSSMMTGTARKPRSTRQSTSARRKSTTQHSQSSSIPTMKELGQEVVSTIRSVLPVTTKRGRKAGNSTIRGHRKRAIAQSARKSAAV